MNKQVVQAQFGEVKGQFDAAFDGLNAKRAEYKAANEQAAKDADRYKKLTETHNAHPPNRKNAAAVKAYNAEADKVNAQIAAFQAKCAQKKSTLDAEIAAATQKLQDVQQNSLAEFNKTAALLLANQHHMRKGLAWRQMVSASQGYNMFDDTSSGDPSAPVDARGVTLMTPAEREKALQQPDAQLPRGFHMTPNAPPPP